jgi:hypothetical protein
LEVRVGALIGLLAGCASTITVNSIPPGSEVYITRGPALENMRPSSYRAAGTTPFQCSIDYWAWENYYVWIDAPGHRPMVQKVRNDFKVGPAAVGFFCCLPAMVWAWGPTEDPIYCNLQPDPGPGDE